MVEGITTAEVEAVDSVATLTPATVDAVVVVAPAIDVAASTAVQRIRRVHGRTPVVVATDEIPATRADAVVPMDADAVGRTVRQVLDDERIERTRRRVGRVVQLAADLDESDDEGSVCERLADGVGYDTAWLVRREDDSIVPVAAAGIPLGALGTVPVDAEDPWARALRSGESVVESGNLSTVAVPFEDRCLICTSDSAVGAAEVRAVEHVVRSTPAMSGSLQPRYALLGKAIAHEVNNQLDVAMVHLDLAEDGDDHLGHVEAALERIDAVIDEVNALVAPELSVDEVSLRDVSVEVWSGVSTADASLEGTDARVEADDRLLRLLLSNLFRNAIQHGGDEVTVQVGPLDGGGFYVADDGSGFADGIGEQLFEWGWSDDGGTGIGLALVSLVADRHGWDVTHSGAEGARFEFRP
ncbi:sensor histidine kinase [Natronomonas salina]|uniref:sensor histidine kinase n=1 Tax=Natronomonas salina TaxID=1710540 RepID=UPI0015B3D8C6|nr:sensor histidine kinase [Natronomonas salina]QLD87921.1 sensor histidine kinase [Natronomonas salina]